MAFFITIFQAVGNKNLSKHYIDRKVLEVFRLSGYHAKSVPHGSLRPSVNNLSNFKGATK